MNRIISLSKAILADESGQELIEYALVAALIAVGSVVALGNLKTGISTAFGNVVTSLSGATSGGAAQ